MKAFGLALRHQRYTANYLSAKGQVFGFEPVDIAADILFE
jgi:hypothetical protein